MTFKIPLQSEIIAYIKEKKQWPEKFITYYAERFWNNYQSSGWKLSNGNAMKDWKACFNNQWQEPKYKGDIDFLNRCMGVTTKTNGHEPGNDYERLDALLSRYLKSPTSIPFEEFGQWYDFMKAEKLLKIFTKGEVFQLQDIYKHDNGKCRCAAVQQTLDGYANTGLRIADLVKMRMQLQK